MFPIHLDLSFIGLKIIYHFEGFYFVIAIVCGLLIARKRFKEALPGISADQSDQTMYISLLFALIGTRLSHFIFWNLAETLRNPLIIITPGVTGASIVGGLIFGIGAGFIYAKIKKYDFYRMFAIVSPALLIAQSIGRIGCFLNGDAFGIAAPKGLGMRFARYGWTFPTFRKATEINSPSWDYSAATGAAGISETRSGWLYPTQLYEIAANMLLLLCIWLVLKKVSNRNVACRYAFYIHAGGYAFFRFLLQFIRTDRAGMLAGNLSGLQLVLLLLTIFFIIAAVKTFLHEKQRGIHE
ncbi:MAG: prolipoprotein diacylglyceryl transferase [Spirochaetales bacterium]|nr:prolipoprotein diacylglyceryl transferase [Spirochaetales bacterium]